MRRTPYESAAAPMSHSAADPAEFNAVCRSKARSKRRSIHAPNLTDELSTAEERRLNQFGSAD